VFNLKKALGTVGIAALIPVGAVSAAGASGVHRADGFSYTVQNAGTEYLSKTGLTATFPGPLETGDQIFSRDSLLRGSRKVGYDNMTCTVTFDSNDLCHAVSVFFGKGDVEATWLWVGRNTSPSGPKHFAGVINGGTGSYENSKGQFEADVLSNGALRITTKLR